MNRIDRISAILIQLQSKPVIRATEIAERFGISIRTVYRDIRALEEAGIPIGSESGVGYFLAEGFHLPPVMFTKKEAYSLLLAEKLIEKMADSSAGEHYKSAMYKIRSVLKDHEKSDLEKLENFIDIARYKPKPQHDFPDNFMSDLQEAIVNNRILNIEYMSLWKNQVTNREIEPLGIVYYGSNWHLISFCLLRNDYRDFRFDRIKTLCDTGKRYQKKKQKSIREFYEELSRNEDVQKVVVRFKNEIAGYTDSQKYFFGFFEQKKYSEFTEMTFLVSPVEYIAKWLISYGNQVDVVEPLSLKEELIKLTEELKLHYLEKYSYGRI